MSNATADPIELLRQIAPVLQNGHKDTLKQAAELVKRLQSEITELRQSLAAQPLPESPACVNFKMVHVVTQTESQFTLRGHTDVELQERLQHRISSLIDSGWVAFDAYVDQRRAERGQSQPTPSINSGHGGQPQPVPGAPPLAVVAPPQAGQSHQSLTFQAKTLAATINDGKTYWKVKGGKFETYGVKVWPEVLEEAGFFMDSLNPMDVYSLADYTATYTIKDDGKPEKVTKLTKAA